MNDIFSKCLVNILCCKIWNSEKSFKPVFFTVFFSSCYQVQICDKGQDYYHELWIYYWADFWQYSRFKGTEKKIFDGKNVVRTLWSTILAIKAKYDITL